jgi:CheY-like chemotaxis protein
MGLAVVLGIVRAHGGAVTVESGPGLGSTFRVFLPLSADGAIRQADQTAETPETDWDGTVLLVEDEEMVRKVCEAALMSLGFTVLLAKDGVEAVEVFRQHKNQVRCVLCDLTMPHMNGWDTLTALRKLAPGIPVILASGYDEAQVMTGDHPELPQAFLSKPYQLQGLRDAIALALVPGEKLSPS